MKLNPTSVVLSVGLFISSASASLNCTVVGDNLNYYKCPNATCPVEGTWKIGDIAWIWCAVDDMYAPEYV